MAFASQKVLWSVPQTVLYTCLTVSCGFLGKWLLLQKGSVEGSANCALHLSPSVLLGPKLRTHTNPVRRKRPIMSLLLGYSLGLFLFVIFLIIRWMIFNHPIIRRKRGRIRHLIWSDRNSLFWMVSWLKPHETQRARPRSEQPHWQHTFNDFQRYEKGSPCPGDFKVRSTSGCNTASRPSGCHLCFAGIFAGSQRPCLTWRYHIYALTESLSWHVFHHALDSLSRLQLCNWHCLYQKGQWRTYNQCKSHQSMPILTNKCLLCKS